MVERHGGGPPTNRILWGTLLASQLVYLGVAASGLARTRETPLDLPLLAWILAALSFAAGVAAHVFWRRASEEAGPAHAGSPDPAASFTPYLLAWVLDESIAVYGLVLALLGFPGATWLPFSAAALALTLLHRPR